MKLRIALRRALFALLAGCLTLSGCNTLSGARGSQDAADSASGRHVGLGYSTWFPPQSWTQAWSAPMFGDYNSSDEGVIRQHAEWLVTAGVDFVWIDWSNNILARQRPELQPIEDATRRLFEVYTQMRERPAISIFLGIDGDPAHIANGNLQRKADQIYEQFVAHPDFGPLMFRHKGKPLLAVYVGYPSPWQDGAPEWDDPRFTVRWMTAFLEDQEALQTEEGASRHGYWSWWERTPQYFSAHEGVPESVIVSAAYPGYYGWGEEGTRGREGGRTFEEQWNRVRAIDPQLVLVNSWNEWVAPEELNPEFSNDLEPSEAWEGIYLVKLRDEIAAWKRMPARKPPVQVAPAAPQDSPQTEETDAEEGELTDAEGEEEVVE